MAERKYKSLDAPDPTACSGPTVEPDEYDILSRELDVVVKMEPVDEYESYTSQSPIQIDCSPLDWWLRDEQRQRYPRLSQMAIDILSIPAMSAGPERVFSGA